MGPLFRNPPQNWSRNLRLSSHCPGWYSLTSLPLRVRQLTHFQTHNMPYICLRSERGNIGFWWFHTCAEVLGPSFSKTFLNSRSYSPVSGWPTRSVLAEATQKAAACSVDSLSAVFSSISPSPEIYPRYIRTLIYRIKLHSENDLHKIKYITNLYIYIYIYIYIKERQRQRQTDRGILVV